MRSIQSGGEDANKHQLLAWIRYLSCRVIHTWRVPSAHSEHFHFPFCVCEWKKTVILGGTIGRRSIVVAEEVDCRQLSPHPFSKNPIGIARRGSTEANWRIRWGIGTCRYANSRIFCDDDEHQVGCRWCRWFTSTIMHSLSRLFFSLCGLSAVAAFLIFSCCFIGERSGLVGVLLMREVLESVMDWNLVLFKNKFVVNFLYM